MKTVVMRDNRVQVEEVDIPQPGEGQVLVKSLACGVCGSDLHILRHAGEIFDFYQQVGVVPADTGVEGLEVNLGHEYCAEVVSYGPQTSGDLAIGSRVTSVPFLLSGEQQLGIGAMPGCYGAYSEYFLMSEALLLPVPEELSDEAVALTEPMAVGLHSVNQAAPVPGEAVLVAGCGPIGLACIAALKRQGITNIVASDPQQRARELARQMGASHTVNPLEQDEIAATAKLAGDNRVVILECVGSPRMIPELIMRAPESACIVFTGLHTSEVAFSPAHALVKQLNIKFSYYYSAQEFAECLQALASGDINWQGMVTGRVGIDGVPAAFEVLLQPNQHTKVIIEPWRNGALEDS